MNNPELMMSYPNHRVCAIIDERSDASDVLDALIKMGGKEDEIEILNGREGVGLLDPDGKHHGFFAKVARMLQAYGDVERKSMHVYETALKKGAFVFIIPAENEDDKNKIKHILTDYKAYELNYFSTWVVESMYRT